MNINSLIHLQGQLFLLMAVGAFLRWKGILSPSFKAGLTDLLMTVILPCNILYSFLNGADRDILFQSAAVLAISLAAQLLSWGVGRLLYHKRPAEERAVLQYGTICSNAGFLGTPLAEGTFGPQGVILASLFLTPMRVAMWSIGLSFFQRQSGRAVWKKVVTHPCIIACALGVVCVLCSVPVPSLLFDTVGKLSSCNTALSMILIGIIIADAPKRGIISRTTLSYSALRLIVLPLIVFVGCTLVKAPTLATQVCVLLTAMPAGGTTAILAAKYHCDEPLAAACVTVSTLLSLVSIPIWSFVLL